MPKQSVAEWLAHGMSAGHPMTPGPDAEPGPVNYHPGPEFYPARAGGSRPATV